MVRVHITWLSSNAKTGPIPVTTTSGDSCPMACPFKGSGCYAETGPLAIHWRKVSSGLSGMGWDEFCHQIKTRVHQGQLWRMNQAGDLPGMSIQSDLIDIDMLWQLVEANKGKKGFTYTHHDPFSGANKEAIAFANALGFTINLSANNLEHADKLADLNCGPVVTVLPKDQLTNTVTPKGRKVVVCPAVTRDNVSCASCGLCQLAKRDCIVGFPVHGTGHRKAAKAMNQSLAMGV